MNLLPLRLPPGVDLRAVLEAAALPAATGGGELVVRPGGGDEDGA